MLTVLFIIAVTTFSACNLTRSGVHSSRGQGASGVSPIVLTQQIAGLRTVLSSAAAVSCKLSPSVKLCAQQQGSYPVCIVANTNKKTRQTINPLFIHINAERYPVHNVVIF